LKKDDTVLVRLKLATLKPPFLLYYTTRTIIRVPNGFDELRGLLNNAASAAKTTGLVQTVTWNKSASLPADVMKILHDNPNVTLRYVPINEDKVKTNRRKKTIKIDK